jgi:hypothetical protein
VVPAVVLVLLLAGTWRAMHGPTVLHWAPEVAAGRAAGAQP